MLKTSAQLVHSRYAIVTTGALLLGASSCSSEDAKLGRSVTCDEYFQAAGDECSPGRRTPQSCIDNREAADLACDTEEGIGVLVPNVAGFRDCVKACLNDDDCGASGVCLCGSSIGRCVPATCRTNADCVDGASCLSWSRPCGSQQTRFDCTTDEDTCHHDGHCPDGTTCSAESGSFRCELVPEPCTVQ